MSALAWLREQEGFQFALCDYGGKRLGAQFKAAADELEAVLEALRNLLADSERSTRQRCAEYGEEYGLGTDAEQAARIAIAKAEGR